MFHDMTPTSEVAKEKKYKNWTSSKLKTSVHQRIQLTE
jgi:hypothetical protein